jgi:hypothetical protein
MLSRSPNSPALLSERAAGMRRLRRRANAAPGPFCRTNGCATFMALDSSSGLYTCPICGSRRLLSN